MKRVAYLAVTALLSLMVLAPTAALAQDVVPGDDDPHLPEPGAVVVEHEELQQIAGQPLPKTGGPALGSLLLPAAALLLGTAVVGYALLGRR